MVRDGEGAKQMVEEKVKGMRVGWDEDLCCSTGRCAVDAPEVFELDKSGNLMILQEFPPEHLRDAVERAVRGCPTQALSLEAAEQ